MGVTDDSHDAKRLELQILSSNEQMEVLDLCMKHEQAKITGWQELLRKKHLEPAEETTPPKQAVLSCTVQQIYEGTDPLPVTSFNSERTVPMSVAHGRKAESELTITPVRRGASPDSTEAQSPAKPVLEVTGVDTQLSVNGVGCDAHSPSPRKLSPRSILGGVAKSAKTRSMSQPVPVVTLPELPTNSPPLPTDSPPQAITDEDTKHLSVTAKGRDASLAMSEMSSNYVTPIQGWSAAKSPISRCPSLEGSPLLEVDGDLGETRIALVRQMRDTKRSEVEAQRRVRVLETLVENLQEGNENQQADAAAEMDVLRAKISSLDEENDALRQEVLKMIEDTEEAEAREKELVEQVAQAEVREVELQEELEKAEEQLKEKEQLEKDLASFKELYSSATKKIERDTADIRRMTKEAEHVETELRITKQLLETESKNLRDKYKALEAEEENKVQLEMRIESLKKTIERYEAEKPAIEQMKNFIKEVSCADDVNEAKRKKAADAYLRMKLYQPEKEREKGVGLGFGSSVPQRPKKSRDSTAGSSTGIYPPGTIGKEIGRDKSIVRSPRRGRSGSVLRARSPSLVRTYSNTFSAPRTPLSVGPDTTPRRASPYRSPTSRPSSPPPNITHLRHSSARRNRPLPPNSIFR